MTKQGAESSRQSGTDYGYDLASRVLYLDSNLIILDKPAGLAVHGGPKTFIHLEGMLDGLRLGLAKPPRLAHRLDRDTSGCLVLARHDKALSRLGRLFGAGKVRKTYWAVVTGRPDPEEGVIEMPLRKVSNKDGWRMIADPAGQAAATRWRRLGGTTLETWLELHPQSGRTHQIRVHCASGLGCPIIGDPVYGSADDRPMHLHARHLVIPYWADRPPVEAIAVPPPHMRAALRDCGWPGEDEAEQEC
ncbi:RNA pseudouridine synthase [Telmatospirillum sp.]|uniref:RluA family pseudouridine synthase n=1 Tax=Telmatospirillum sp. TaxID=2079197 RepID=UPI00283EB580|nr:RNA pseudouridine synthase [Telmatospirillum sp.]MDR3437471.1 RNA pseudouridine synthase [Telmatospirillum sp.]